MLQRVEYTEWHLFFPKLGFALFFIAFVVIVWRASRLRKDDSERVSRLPLDD